MARFAPALSMNQLRLLVAGRDYQTDKLTGLSLPHIPDKVDRCGKGGGCAGKPPLLSWSVWEVFNQTKDEGFLQEMYPIIDGFHRFWYHHRDTLGVGLCSWTGGADSAVLDAFQPPFLKRVRSNVAQAWSQGWTMESDFHSRGTPQMRRVGSVRSTFIVSD